jgi:hypothetical protein
MVVGAGEVGSEKSKSVEECVEQGVNRKGW